MAIGMCHFRYLWNGMFARAEGQNTTLGPLWPRVVSPKMVLSMGQIELFDIKLSANK